MVYGSGPTNDQRLAMSFSRLSSFTFVAFLLLTAVAAVLKPSAVDAQPRRMDRTRIYFVASTIEPELEAVTARVGSAARAALRNEEQADWQDADQRYLGYAPEMVQTLATARQLLEEGRNAYLELDLETAITSLTASVEAFDQAQAALEDERDLGSALLYLGASLSFNGDARAAHGVFQRLNRQVPHIVPDPAEFPPEVITSYERAQPRRTNARLHIESDPSGAIAYVDFVPRGLTGLTIENLAPGEHTVRLTRPGATPYVEQIELGRSQGEVAAFLMDAEGNEGLSELVDRIKGHQMQVGDGAIHELGERLNLEQIGVIQVSYGSSQETVKLELAIFDVATQRRILRGEVDAPRALGELEPVVQQSIGRAVGVSLADTSAVAVSGSEDTESPFDVDQGPQVIETREPLRRKWWLWTIVGVAVVGGVTAAILLTRDSGPSNGEVVIQW